MHSKPPKDIIRRKVLQHQLPPRCGRTHFPSEEREYVSQEGKMK